MCYHRYGWPGNRFSNKRGGSGRWASTSAKYVPVNILENENNFELSLYAPELQKEAFTISVKDDVLTVSYLPAEEAQSNTSNFTRREYRNESFERSFVLNGKVEVEKIIATYTEGILKITLAKDPERNKPARNISVV